jgi:signal transduction histidine kinase
MGAITCAYVVADHHYDNRTFTLIREIASRAALGLDNARLHREAQQAVRSRDEVLRVVAHDLRNPLNTISLSADLLTETAQSQLKEDAAHELDMIIRSAERADRLIEDLMEVARMEAGGIAVTRKPISAAELVGEAIRVNNSLVAEKGLHLETKVESGLPNILADRERLLRVFDNLVGNALKFSPSGTRLTLGAARTGRFVRFTVSDTGPGMSAECQAHLFHPFWQGAGTATGTGLGLSICRAIVEAHYGRIWVESKEGEGTQVFFTIPVTAEEPTVDKVR